LVLQRGHQFLVLAFAGQALPREFLVPVDQSFLSLRLPSLDLRPVSARCGLPARTAAAYCTREGIVIAVGNSSPNTTPYSRIPTGIAGRTVQNPPQTKIKTLAAINKALAAGVFSLPDNWRNRVGRKNNMTGTLRSPVDSHPPLLQQARSNRPHDSGSNWFVPFRVSM
jgi:hypothetical protein